ncbi:acyl-CoA dehydrogenase family protein [Nocardioides bigeumensis]|uniref:Acyl-[acyl-carrier-protein] dehydrogenase MbtN n=1 Tax=Nocardioides bigeumensis TaxID=433657 RepID=A0ABP5JMY7_9ACTN
MSRRELFDDEHEAFREAVGTFLDKEVVPHHEQWEADGIVSREAWTKAGAQGLLGLQLDEAYGGGGTDDFRYNAVVGEEMTKRGTYGAAYTLFNDMIAPYLAASATEEQKQRWFPGLCSGETIAAIAMSEPGAGSDLQGIQTSARLDGDHYVLNGQKTFISNGILADLVLVVARTDPDAGHQGISLLVVERGMEGFERGRNLDKIGQHAQDTAELFFDDVRVPRENLLGEEGSGFLQLMTNLSQERLSMAVSAATACERVLDLTLSYAKERTAFGRPIGKFQHNRFVIAEMATEARIARVFVDDCIAKHVRGELDAATASMAKWWTTEVQKKVVDQGVQMHGGYGYMSEYPIARAYLNSRVQTIYGGTTEIQKEIIGRSLGL